ncbi:hypothetical protein WH52_09050 [Tenacibaculum holothuriorum]|uniref:Glycosyltransferase 2-like domain-containing protein n=1 Tax=Tenacibaculum holothuriorum TaxID=1635173 RepID=A0A1Y2PCF3_9FLAO|nr:glycosyltransferase family A protein [Tenacibaculum holothuriorum]OSY88152.1 hypothetical protein WH52_09050 [Tenacibaculum holothuriorum]
MVSIIMPVYNVEKYIAKSVQSVLDQTFVDFELLVINDGTKDASIDVLKKFNDQRIKVFHKKNGGLSDARNYGMERAKGEYIYFMDSDDWVEPNILEVCLNKMTLYHSDFLIFGYFLDKEDTNGKVRSSVVKKHFEIEYSRERVDLKIDRNTLNLMGYAWNKFYKASFLKSNKLKFEKGVSLVEDILFNTQVYNLSKNILFIEEPLYHYIDRPTVSLIKTFHKNSFELKIKKANAVLNFLELWKIDDSQKKNIMSDLILNSVRYCAHNLFSFKNDLNLIEKYKYLKMMVNDDKVQEYVSSYKPTSISDKVIKRVIEIRNSVLLYCLYKIKK